MTHGSLFSGIGGFDLAAEWAGWENRFHCERNEFGQKILKYYWPNAKSYGDITQTDFTIWRGRIDVLTGGFPCQPYSAAGKRRGKDDPRHLWPQMLRAIREIQPRWVVGENVRGLTNWNGGLVFDEVQADLEAAGYEVTPFLLPACAVDAPHRRDRIWFIAHRNSSRLQTTRAEQQAAGLTGSCSQWTATHTNHSGNATHRCGAYGHRTTQGIERQQPQFELSRPCNTWLVTHTASKQGEWLRPEQREHCEPKQGQFGGDGCELGCGRNATDSESERVQGHRPDGQQESRTQTRKGLFGRNDSGNGWANFPTQSPVCGRNDGLSGKLDGITFPKWRNESIKAYGNAIVPQVAYQIFKAINQYEHLS